MAGFQGGRKLITLHPFFTAWSNFLFPHGNNLLKAVNTVMHCLKKAGIAIPRCTCNEDSRCAGI